jgi:hypothetical protein
MTRTEDHPREEAVRLAGPPAAHNDSLGLGDDIVHENSD